MRILVVYNSALDSRSVSGVQRHFAGVLPEWFAAGHRIDFLTGRSAFPVFRDLFPRSRLVSSDGLFDATGHLHQTWRFLPPLAWRCLTAHFTRLMERYDLIYACGPQVFEVYAAMVIARRQRAKLAVKIHHVVAVAREARGVFDRLFQVTERLSTRWLNRRADVILCTTEPVARDWNQLETSLGLVPRALAITGNGLDVASVPFGADTPKEFDAVLMGRVHEHKGVFDAPALWRAVVERRPGARLLVIGEGPHRAELQRRFAELGLGGNVTFTGGIPDAEKNALLPRCRIGLSLSREEGWGFSVAEFLAAGLPVVAMDLPIFHHVFPEQLDLAPMGDTATGASRVLAWLADEARCREQAMRGRAFVVRYDHREVARAELAALLGAVGQGR